MIPFIRRVIKTKNGTQRHPTTNMIYVNSSRSVQMHCWLLISETKARFNNKSLGWSRAYTPGDYSRDMKESRMLISSLLLFSYQLWRSKMMICLIYLEKEHELMHLLDWEKCPGASQSSESGSLTGKDNFHFRLNRVGLEARP